MGPLKFDKTGETYIGEFLDGLRHGFGECVSVSGSGYIGLWSLGKRSGNGTELEANGDSYAGDWVEGVKSGKGVYRLVSLQYIYEGEMAENEFCGNGKMTFNDGSLYIGGFRKGKKEGEGRFEYCDGATYVGSFLYDTYDTGTFGSNFRSI